MKNLFPVIFEPNQSLPTSSRTPMKFRLIRRASNEIGIWNFSCKIGQFSHFRHHHSWVRLHLNNNRDLSHKNHPIVQGKSSKTYVYTCRISEIELKHLSFRPNASYSDDWKRNMASNKQSLTVYFLFSIFSMFTVQLGQRLMFNAT